MAWWPILCNGVLLGLAAFFLGFLFNVTTAGLKQISNSIDNTQTRTQISTQLLTHSLTHSPTYSSRSGQMMMFQFTKETILRFYYFSL